MSEGRPKKALPPEELAAVRRGAAEGAGAAIERELPTDGHGLGSVGEQIIRYRLTPENEGDPEDRRDIVWFTRGWRGHIRRMTDAHLDAVYDRATRDLERGVLVRAWRGTVKVGIGFIVTAFVVMHWFSDQVAWIVGGLPFLREIWRVIRGGGT